jgi:hypothetical protein
LILAAAAAELIIPVKPEPLLVPLRMLLPVMFSAPPPLFVTPEKQKNRIVNIVIVPVALLIPLKVHIPLVKPLVPIVIELAVASPMVLLSTVILPPAPDVKIPLKYNPN